MINRKVIRRKALQNLYRQKYLQAEARDIKSALKKDLEAVYCLYLYLLNTLEEVSAYSRRYYDEKQGSFLPFRDKFQSSYRFSENFMIRKLNESKDYQKLKDSYQVFWADEDNLLRRMFLDFKASDLYQEYIHSREQAAFEEEEILLYFLRHYTKHFNLYRQHLEELYPNFQDDQKLAVNMASKTIRNIAADPENEDFIVPLAMEWEEKLEYAFDLIDKSSEVEQEYNDYILPLITQWEPSQLATIDVIIMRMVLAEYLYFPSIPTQVTMNEYLELAKNFSQPGSKKFLNAVLDKACKNLEKEGKIKKSGTGLFKNSAQS